MQSSMNTRGSIRSQITPTTKGQREIIKLSDKVPTVVKLDFGAEGIERAGKYRPQFMYTVNDDAGVLFVDPPVRNAIVATGAQAGDEVRIEKRAGKYHATLLSDAAEPEPAPKPALVAVPRTNGAAAALKPNGAAKESNGYAHRLAGCYQVAIDALITAADYAKSRSWLLDFNEEDVRATALTLLIGLQRGDK